MKKITDVRGFTIVELLLIMGITSILVSLVTINLLKVQHNASVSTATDTFISDIKGQQVKAMNGSTLGTSGYSYGIYFDPTIHTKYTLFRGTTYNSSDTTNQTVNIDTSMTITSTFPINPGTANSSIIVFSQQSGEIPGFTVGKNTITLKHKTGNEQKVITLNKYGVITIIN